MMVTSFSGGRSRSTRRELDYLTSQAYHQHGVGSLRLCTLQKGCTRLAAASDNGYQLLVYGRWLSPGTPASSTTKTGHHHKGEILLKVTLSTKGKLPIIKGFRMFIYFPILSYKISDILNLCFMFLVTN
jgi:hypothetical protein